MGWEGATTSKLTVDNKTLVYNSAGQLGINPAEIIPSASSQNLILLNGATVGSVTISSNETLSQDLIVDGDITIDTGVTLTTNGHSILCSGIFTNNGTIDTGYAGGGGFIGGASAGAGIYIQADQIIAGTINSQGGTASLVELASSSGNIAYAAGGGGGGGVILLAYGSGGYTAGTYNVAGGAGVSEVNQLGGTTWTGGAGGSTVATGGTASTAAGTNAGDGSTPSAPSLSASTIQSWYLAGMSNYVAGGSGGGGGGYGASGSGADATNGSAGGSRTSSYGGSGGGGATNSTSTLSGNGGAGQTLTYNYSTAPLTISSTGSADLNSGVVDICTLGFTPSVTGVAILNLNAYVNGVATVTIKDSNGNQLYTNTTTGAGNVSGTISYTVIANDSYTFTASFSTTSSTTVALKLFNFSVQNST